MKFNKIEQRTRLIADGVPFKYGNITISTTDSGKLLVTWWTQTIYIENITKEKSERELDQLKEVFAELVDEYDAIESLRNNFEIEFLVSYDTGKAGVGICSEINNELIWYIEK